MEYGLYNWWQRAIRPDEEMDGKLDKLIYEEDLKLAEKLVYQGRVFIKEGRQDKYIVICYGDYKLRVCPSNWVAVDGDGFTIADNVRVISNGGRNTPREAQICDMSWHYDQEKIIYTLIHNGKRLKKRYFIEDLEKL